MPADIDVKAIAEEAIQACFAKVAEGLAAAGYEVSGDFMPHEVDRMDRMFQGFVRAMALNNGEISDLNED